MTEPFHQHPTYVNSNDTKINSNKQSKAKLSLFFVLTVIKEFYMFDITPMQKLCSKNEEECTKNKLEKARCMIQLRL